jgi:hypothetical protein
MFPTLRISSSVAAHVLAVILILIAVLGTFVQIAHRNQRQKLFLAHPAGTIACAVSIGASGQLGQMVARLDENENKKHMYDTEATHDRLGRRKSVFSSLLPRRMSMARNESHGEPKSA